MTDLLNNLDKESKQETDKELKVTKYKLEEMVTNVHKYDNGLVIAEFNNGLSVAYEKICGNEHQDDVISYYLIPFKHGDDLRIGEFGICGIICHRKEKIGKNRGPRMPANLLRTHELINVNSQKYIEEHMTKKYPGHDLNSICKEIIKPLEISLIRERNIGETLEIVKLSGIFGFLFCTEKIGDKKINVIDYLKGVLEFGVVSAFVIGNSLLFGNGTGYSANGKNLTKESNGKSPKITFYDSDCNKFRNMKISFQNETEFFMGMESAPDEKIEPKEITNYFISLDERKSYEIPSNKKTEYYLNADSDILDKFYQTASEKERAWAKWRFFAQELKAANHEGLLKKIGFI